MRSRTRSRTQSPAVTLAEAARFAVELLEGRVLLSAGDPDPTFGTGGKLLLPDHAGSVSYYVNTDAVQSDGKILLAGSAASSDASAGGFFLERLNIDGTPDATFGSGGVVTTAFAGGARANTILIQADGKIVLGGGDFGAASHFALARYDTNGSLNSGFGSGGKVTSQIPGPTDIKSLAFAPDGKIVAGGIGTYQDPAHPTNAAYSAKVLDVAHYTTGGSLDAGFGGGNGYVVQQIPRDNLHIYDTAAVAVQSDGKVLLGSHLAIDMAVWRFNVNGTPDFSFGLDGRAVTPMPYFDGIDIYDWASVSQMIVQPNGQILVAGPYINDNTFASWAVSRYNPDGSLDTAFGNQGVAIPDIHRATPGNDPLGGLALQTDGRIIVGGSDNTAYQGHGAFIVKRLLPNGAADPTFHSYDIQYGEYPNATVGATAMAPDGRIIVAGNDDSVSGIAVFRLLNDSPPAGAVPAATPANPSGNQPGDLDPAYGFQGRTLFRDAGPFEFPDAITPRVKATAVLANGKVLLAGSIGTVANDGKGQFFLERLYPDGTVDTTFGSGGSVATSVGPLAFATSMLVQPDGKILLGGTVADSATNPTNYSFALARYNADGSPDTAFGSAGKEITDFPGNEEIDSLAFGPGGTIVAAGSYFLYPTVGFDLARYTGAGLLDTSFNGTGKLSVDLGQPGDNALPAAVAVQADGKVVVGSHAADQFAVYRFNVNGTPDAGFGSNGVASTFGALTSRNFPATSDGSITGAVTKLVVQPDGKILAAGQTPDRFNPFALVRFNANGTLDSHFSSSGGQLVASTLRQAIGVSPLAALLLQPIGEIVLVGNQTALQGGSLNNPGTEVLIRKFLADGSPDPFFDVDQDPQYLPPPPLRGAALAEGAALSPGGSLVVASDVWADRTPNSPHWLGVARYLNDAALVGTAANDAITLVRDADGTHIDWINGPIAGQIVANDPAGLTLVGNGGTDTITLNFSQGNPLPGTLRLDGTFTLTGLQGSNPLAGACIDIGPSTVYIAYASPAADPTAAIRNYLANGYDAGNWAGAPTASAGVITSRQARDNASHNTGIGYADLGDGSGANTTPNTLELKYTLNGDATLDGKVNIFDLNALLPTYNKAGAWTGGDSTYDGKVNIFDLNALLPNYNKALGSQAAPAATPATTSAISGTSSGAQAVAAAANVSPGIEKPAHPQRPPRRTPRHK